MSNYFILLLLNSLIDFFIFDIKFINEVTVAIFISFFFESTFNLIIIKGKFLRKKMNEYITLIFCLKCNSEEWWECQGRKILATTKILKRNGYLYIESKSECWFFYGDIVRENLTPTGHIEKQGRRMKAAHSVDNEPV